MKKIAFLVLATLLLPSLSQVVATSGRASNIDLAVGDISITYTDSTNRSKFQMFSSNYPIIGFNKPQSLYVTDGVLNVEMNINVKIDNIGTVQSGFVDVQFYVLHNEYTRFELLNTTVGISPIPGSSTGSADVLWTPTYSGNHTLQIIVSNSNGDDDLSNNQKSRHMTVAYSYDNCDDLTTWSKSGEWSTSSDAIITPSYSCHVGNGESSTYSSSTTSTLTTPVMNLADDVNDHKAAIGYSFFYTGGANTGDMLTGYALDDAGNWDQTFTLQNVVDNNFQDGSSNWQTFTASYNNRNSPLIPLGNEHFHANSQFRFTFTSDGSAEDIGYWFDELVIIYDQAARKDEFNIDMSGVNTFGGLPGDWSITRLAIENIGNISARYTPDVSGIPEGWTYYFSNINGANIGSSGLELLPGETKIFDLRVMVDENASQGNIPVIVNVTSNTHSDIQDSITTSVKVLPSRIPDLIVPEFTPRCKPGQTCMFPVELRNIGEATDVFNISVEDKNVPNGWTISLSWNQSNMVLVRTDSPQHIWLTATVPQGIEPDVTAEVYLTATSTNDTRRSDTEVIDVAAAMSSNASVQIEETMDIEIDPGSSVDISVRVFNNASRIDIFSPDVAFTDTPGWSVVLLNTPDMAISPGASSTFKVRITSPSTAQAGDLGPMISPKVLSSRSGEEITGNAWQGVKVASYRNISIELLANPVTLTPGIAINFDVKISNYGNGPDTAQLSLPWSPSTWTWWALSDGVNVTESIDLSAPYDLMNEKTVNVWLLLDPLEAPGEIHEITIQASSINAEDISPSDNIVMFEAVTEVIKQPRLDGYFGETIVETNSSYKFNAIAWNIGNSVDTSLRSKLLIQTSPPTQCVIGFIETDSGLSKPSNEWMMMNLGPTQSTNITMDILIGPDCPLNTIVSAKLQLEGGADNIGRPILKELTAVLMVGERRNVEIDYTKIDDVTVPYDANQLLWINLTSTSTQKEILNVTAYTTDGWGVVCDEIPIHTNSVSINLNEGHLNEQIHNLRCEIIRESGAYSSTVNISIIGEDGRINFNLVQSLTWEKEPEVDRLFSFKSPIFVGTTVAIVILIGVLLMVFLRNGEDEFSDDDKYEAQDYNEPVTGPPASSFEPQQQESTQVVDPAMAEYQRQLDEYNRQMAEYQAWQESQGSQS